VSHHQDLFESIGAESACRPDSATDAGVLSTNEYPSFEDLRKAVRYILYYLSIIASQENVSLIYYLAQRVKHYKDGAADQPEYRMSTQLYIMSDLARICIATYKDVKGWNIQTFPSTVVLPSSFIPLPADIARKLLAKPFIRDEDQSRVVELVRGYLRAPKRRLDPDGPTVKKESAKEKKEETQRERKVLIKKVVKSMAKQSKGFAKTSVAVSGMVENDGSSKRGNKRQSGIVTKSRNSLRNADDNGENKPITESKPVPTERARSGHKRKSDAAADEEERGAQSTKASSQRGRRAQMTDENHDSDYHHKSDGSQIAPKRRRSARLAK
jgi:sister-chromatid-cohesion protein PDS5